MPEVFLIDFTEMVLEYISIAVWKRCIPHFILQCAAFTEAASVTKGDCDIGPEGNVISFSS